MAGRSNAEWLADLRSSGPAKEVALADLRSAILSGLPYALSTWLTPDHPQYEDFIEEIAQETLLRALARLDTFEGRSQFTTWALKIAVRLALTELRRRRWRDVSLEAMLESEGNSLPATGLMADIKPGPETIAEQSDLLRRLDRLIREELTEKQSRAMLAIIRGMPADEVARRMGMDRNALYKLLHDARLRLKRRMQKEGLTPADFWTVFGSG
jgi:RNA polymerase sigma-70 factor (ECF subfamily)